MQLRQAAASRSLPVPGPTGSGRPWAGRHRAARPTPFVVRAASSGDNNNESRAQGHGSASSKRQPMGKTNAAAAASPQADTVDDLMLKLAALGSAALGADAESAAAALANISSANARAEKEKQPRRMKLLRQQVAALSEKQAQLEQEMNRKEEEFREVRAQLAQQAAAAEQLASAREEAEAAAQRMKAELLAAQQRVDSVSEQAARFQEQEEEIEEYKRQLQETWDELQHERMHREELKAEIINAERAAMAARNLASEVKDLQTTVTAALKKKQADALVLQEQLARSMLERGRLEEMLVAMEEQTSELEAQLQEATDERGIMQQRALYLQSELETARKLNTHQLDGQAAILAAQLEEADSVAQAAKALVLAERERNAELQAALREAEAVRQQLEQQGALSFELQEESHAAEAAAAQMQAEVAAAREQAARYQQQAEEIEAYKLQLSAAAALQMQLSEAVSERDRLQQRSAELEAEVSSLRSRPAMEDQFDGQSGTLIAQLKAAQKDAAAKQSAIQAAVVKAADLQAQLAAAVRERERLQGRSLKLEQDLLAARTSQHQDQQAIQSLGAELDKAKELAARAVDLEAQLSATAEERSRLQQRSAQLEEQLASVTFSAQQRQQELQNEVAALAAQLQTARQEGHSRASQLSAQLAQAEAAVNAAQGLAGQLEEARNDLASAKALAAAQLEEAHTVAQAAKALVLAERDRNAELQAERNAALQDVEQLNYALGSWQAEAEAARQAQAEEQQLRLAAEDKVLMAHQQVQQLTQELVQAQSAADQLLEDLHLLGDLQDAARGVMEATRQEAQVLQELERATERVELLHQRVVLGAQVDEARAQAQAASSAVAAAAAQATAAGQAVGQAVVLGMPQEAIVARPVMKEQLEMARSAAQQEAEQLAQRASSLAAQLEAAHAEAKAARADAEAQRGRNSLLEKAWLAALENVKALQSGQGQTQHLQDELAEVQRDAALLAAQLEEARQDVAAALAQASAAVSRNALLEKAWALAVQDAKVLKNEQRDLKAALKASKKEVATLASKLDAATAQLEAARREADSAKRHAAVARSRNSLLEKAWQGALWRLGAACEWAAAGAGRRFGEQERVAGCPVVPGCRMWVGGEVGKAFWGAAVGCGCGGSRVCRM